MNPCETYSDMENFYTIQVIDLRFQVDQISLQNIQIYDEFRANPTNAIFFAMLFRHREIQTQKNDFRWESNY